jgi:formamidopyrimidine-DNA glycosylase
MPELPEVETIARTLREGRGAPSLVGRRIRSVHVAWPREVHGLSVEAFAAAVQNSTFVNVDRVGKYLTFELEKEHLRRVMLVHLRMSGRLDVLSAERAMTRHARVVWELDEDLALTFDDARKFGRVYLPERIEDVTGRIGPDALRIGAADFAQRLRDRRGALKSVLLDQAFAAGVGNIYADETLFRAGLHPLRRAQTIDDTAALRLHACMRDVLLEGIAANGASFDWVYPGGNFQDNFRVYGRTGRPCVTCGEPIQRIVVGQRSTHFCVRCQK